MSKGIKLVLAVLAVYLGLSFLHLWLNIGLDKVMPGRESQAESSFRVGFLPVT
jgi:hypothetical protein